MQQLLNRLFSYSIGSHTSKILRKSSNKTCTVTICSLACNVQICVDHRPCRPCLSYLSASVVLLMFFECRMARASGVRFGRLCYSGTWGAARPRWSERVWTCCWQVTMGHPRWIKIDKDWCLKHIETWDNHETIMSLHVHCHAKGTGRT